MNEKWEGQPSHSLMESKDLLVAVINNLTNVLDSIGFYVFDYDMVINSPKQFTDLDQLRRACVDNQAEIKFRLESFVSTKAWDAFEEPSTDFFGIGLIPLADLFKFEQDANEEE